MKGQVKSNIYAQILFRWEKDVMKKKFDQVNKEIILNYVVKNTCIHVWQNNVYKLIGSNYFIDNGLWMLHSELLLKSYWRRRYNGKENT